MVHLVLEDGRHTLPREVVRLMAGARHSLDVIAPIFLEEPRLRSERSTVRLRVVTNLAEGTLDPLALRRFEKRFLGARSRFAEGLDGCLVIVDGERAYVGANPFAGLTGAGAVVSGKGRVASRFFEGVWKGAKGGGGRLLELAASRTPAPDGPVSGQIRGRDGTFLDTGDGVLPLDAKGWPSLVKACARAPIATLTAKVEDSRVVLDRDARFRITDHLKRDAKVDPPRGTTSYTLACGVTAVQDERHGMNRGTLITVEGNPSKGPAMKAEVARKAWALPKARFPLGTEITGDEERLTVVELCDGTRDMVEVEAAVRERLGNAAVDMVLNKLITLGAISYER